jgi:hypothetical protein
VRSRDVRGGGTMTRAWLGALALSASACRAESPSVFLSLDVASESGLRLEELEVSPAQARRSLRVEGHRAVLELSRAPGRVTVSAPFACPLELEPDALSDSEQRSLSGLFDFGAPVRVIGFDRPFEVRAVPRCEASRGASATIDVVGGAALAQVELLENRSVFRAKTGTPEALFTRAAPGLVAVSDRERGATRLRAEVRLSDGRTRAQSLEVAATTRASGLANVALEHEVLIRGDRVELVEAPPGSRARLVRYARGVGLVPDVSGRFVLADGEGRFTLATGRYDETPLDCGRAECHRRETEGAATTAMTHALARTLDGTRPASETSCTLACHATGEPGRADGGFSHVRSELDIALPPRFEALPRALVRLGGVGCLACHGPGAVPEPHTRFAVLGRGVCAVCHDSPPRYGHVAAFETSRMARSDSDPRTRESECARCHTSAGALGRPTLATPVGVTLGIGCAVCHDPHPDRAPTSPLLRELPRPATMASLPAATSGPSVVCLGCHAPAATDRAPEASAASLWSASGGVEPESGGALAGTAIHASHPRGCLSCHDAAEPGVERGASHGFRANRSRCAPCHASPPAPAPEIRTRAGTLRERLEARLGSPPRNPNNSGPPHAERRALPNSALGRALYDVLLVLEDPAADVHNPAYARLLLDRAEAALRPGSASHAKAPP